MKILNNPLYAIMEDQKQGVEALRSSLPVNVMDMIARPRVSPVVESAKAAIGRVRFYG